MSRALFPFDKGVMDDESGAGRRGSVEAPSQKITLRRSLVYERTSFREGVVSIGD